MSDILDDTRRNLTIEKAINNHNTIEAIREYLEIMSNEPEGYIKMSEVYHSIRRILGDE
jgi:CRISPR/Cas system-associated endonuclease Cas3-HD